MNIVNELKRTKVEVLVLYNMKAEDLVKSYGEGKWNNKQILHHLADAETVLYERIRRGISKPNQVVWGFDQDAWANKLNYNKMPLEINKSVFTSVRNAIIYLADQYYQSYGDNIYMHNETGHRSVKEEFEKVVWHADHHIAQIRKALAR